MSYMYKRWMVKAVLAVSAFSTPVIAFAWPNKPVTMVVGYAAGGGTDYMARLVANELSKEIGQNIIVENRPGANGNLAAAYVARASADGYTMLFGGSNHVTNSSMYQKLAFDFSEDMVPVGLVASLPNILVVHPSVQAHSVRELIELAKQRPGDLNFGSSGVGSSQHLSGEQFMRMADVRMMHVPYRGSAPAVVDLLGGNIQIMFDNATSALPNIRSGKLRALGLTGEKRSGSAADIPTIAESGLPGFDVMAWLGVFVPKDTPMDVQQKLNDAINQLVARPAFQEQISTLAADPMQGDLERSAEFVAQENDKWSQLVSDIGITLD